MAAAAGALACLAGGLLGKVTFRLHESACLQLLHAHLAMHWSPCRAHRMHCMSEKAISIYKPRLLPFMGRPPAQALNEIPRERAEWILWLDMDLLIDNMDFTFPLAQYEGKNMILHGNGEWIKQGEARAGASPLHAACSLYARACCAHCGEYGLPQDSASCTRRGGLLVPLHRLQCLNPRACPHDSPGRHWQRELSLLGPDWR